MPTLRFKVSLAHASTVAMVIALFLFATLPLAFERVTGGRSAERQAYTAGIIRMYCEDPGRSVFKGPQIHFGRNPFNLEFTGFEWAQGLFARAAGGAECDNVEAVGKVFSILCSAIGIFALALLAAHLFGGIAGVVAAALLAFDGLWMRYATYTMIENRVLALGVLAILFSIKRKPRGAFVFWALTFTAKPQIFLFIAGLWVTIELFWAKQPLRKLLTAKKEVLAAFGGAVLVGFAWFGWSLYLDQKSDLPWIIHTGPRESRWYFGDWAERFSVTYWKNLFFWWFKDSGLNVALPVLAVTLKRNQLRPQLAEALRRAFPLLVAVFLYTFAYYHVYKVHEYYALPVNVGRALATAGLLALIVAQVNWRKRDWRAWLAVAVVVLVVGRYATVGLKSYADFALNVNNPTRDFYHPDWDVQVFPKKHAFVVMAVPGNGRDLLHLYLTKQRGFLWCAHNVESAPRKYWKEQGVEYVAWAQGVDAATGRHRWLVRSLDDELKLAREKGWSSDLPGHDFWAAHSMNEWASIASYGGKDPCDGVHKDPRKWVTYKAP